MMPVKEICIGSAMYTFQVLPCASNRSKIVSASLPVNHFGREVHHESR
jgi:hypothetical protein